MVISNEEVKGRRRREKLRRNFRNWGSSEVGEELESQSRRVRKHD